MVIVYVGGLTKDVTEKDLQEFFGRRVQIRRVEINRKHTRVFSNIKGVPAFAFLDCMCDEDQLTKVLAYNRCYWNGAYLRVQVAKKGPYVYTSRIPEERCQADACELSGIHTEPCPHSFSQKDNIVPNVQSVVIDTPKPNPTKDTEQQCSRRKRIRVFNTLRPVLS